MARKTNIFQIYVVLLLILVGAWYSNGMKPLAPQVTKELLWLVGFATIIGVVAIRSMIADMMSSSVVAMLIYICLLYIVFGII
jgi:hypothetical protein